MKKKLPHPKGFFLASFLFFALAANSQTIRYVKTVATGTGTGNSWANASASIQDMINASAPGDAIWVASGTYYPSREPDGSVTNSRNFTFFMHNGVKLYGGFAGTETSLSQRVAGSNITTLSGWFSGDPFSSSCYHVVLNSGLDSTTYMDGLTILYGNADSTNYLIVAGDTIFNDRGADVYNRLSSIHFNNVTFDIGNANYGNGLYNYGSSPFLSGCKFVNNSVMIKGGAIWNDSSSAPTITDNIFEYNQSQGTGGGAIYNLNSSPIISSCYFHGNFVAGTGNGGGIYDDHSAPTIINCFFNGNYSSVDSSNYGGAIYNNHSSPGITNCIFHNNTSFSGGAVGNDSSSSPLIMNSTFCANYIHDFQKSHGKAIYNVTSSNPVIKNCILWEESQGAFDLALPLENNNSTPTATYSDIYGGYTGSGNLNIDPQFINPNPAYVNPPQMTSAYTEDLIDGFRLQNCSPVINMGDNSGVPATDIIDSPRIQLAIVDMGAFESSSNSLDSSAAINQTSNPDSVVTLTQNSNGTTFYATDCSSLIATVATDGTPNSLSGSVTASLWLKGIPSAEPYVRRLYQILPVSNTTSTKGSVTLYFLQSDFNDYNARFTGLPKLPQSSTDAGGKADLFIIRSYGPSSDGSGLIGSYSGGNKLIDPADTDIVWNAVENRWEVTFTDTLGFGGFFVQSGTSVVPIDWVRVNATVNSQGRPYLTWTVQEENVLNFKVQQSLDGTHFTTIGKVASKGNGQNYYSFTGLPLTKGVYFYRIRQIEVDHAVSDSKVMEVYHNEGPEVSVGLFPNPTTNHLIINIFLSRGQQVGYRLVDNTGKVLLRNNIALSPGHTEIPLDIHNDAPGVYYLEVEGATFVKQIELVKY